jgi:hypothetical protein
MKKQECPICGAMELVVRYGAFRFTPPSNIPGGVMVVNGAEWEECRACGEQILDDKIDKALEKIKVERLSNARKEKEKQSISTDA